MFFGALSRFGNANSGWSRRNEPKAKQCLRAVEKKALEILPCVLGQLPIGRSDGELREPPELWEPRELRELRPLAWSGSSFLLLSLTPLSRKRQSQCSYALDVSRAAFLGQEWSSEVDFE